MATRVLIIDCDTYFGRHAGTASDASIARYMAEMQRFPAVLRIPGIAEPVTVDPEPSDWEPTHEHFPVAKKDGGHRTVDNSILAHRLCNRIDHSIRVGRSHRRDLERVRKAREAAIRRTT